MATESIEKVYGTFLLHPKCIHAIYSIVDSNDEEKVGNPLGDASNAPITHVQHHFNWYQNFLCPWILLGDCNAMLRFDAIVRLRQFFHIHRCNCELDEW